MTDQEHLERGYRRLLAWYPRAFRRESGPEILAVLMACAPDGRRRPGLAESADLIRNGLWMRLRPGVPRSARTVRAAVRLMCAGAAASGASLIIMLAVIAGIRAGHAVLGLRLTAAQVSQVNTPVITQVIVSCLVPVAVWLWMARANGQGRNWARILFTALFSLTTLTLAGVFPPAADQYPGPAGGEQHHCPAVGDPYQFRPDGPYAFHPGARPGRPRTDRAGRPRTDLAGRSRRGGPALAPGLQRVLQVAGSPAGPAQGAEGRTRADPVVQGTVTPRFPEPGTRPVWRERLLKSFPYGDARPAGGMSRGSSRSVMASRKRSP